jgi:membrane-bound lytic murein transglycosylase B
MRALLASGLGFVCALTGVPEAAMAQEAPQESVDAGFQGYLQLLAARARGAGVREQTIAQTMAGLTYNPRVIAFDRNQPGSGPSGSIPAFEPYRRRHVDAGRIARGRRVYAESADMLAQISRRYGVPASVVLAIWGHESNFGSFTGNFDLARSLATLAYDGRRRELFADEFVAVLKMIDRGVPGRSWWEAGPGPLAIRSSCPASICAWRRMPMATDWPTSGRAGSTRWPRSPTISAMQAGARGSPGALR